MGYYLQEMDFYGIIPAVNVPKISEDFLERFEIEKDETGNIVNFWKDDLKLNFEDEIVENAALIKPGSYIKMIGEDGAPFTWVIDPKYEFGYEEFDGESLFPRSELGRDFTWSVSELLEHIPEIEEGCSEISSEFESDGKRYKLTLEAIEGGAAE